VKKTQLLFLLAAIGLVATGRGQRNQSAVPIDYPYSAALISTINPGHNELVIFPLRGKALSIPIRSASGPFAYGRDGRALYGQCSPDPVRVGDPVKIALCKIDLKNTTTTTVRGSEGLYVASFTVSNREDRILAAGLRRRDGDIRGLFEIAIPDGWLRPVFLQADKTPKSSWRYLSLSPDGKRAVGSHNGRVELIDIQRGLAEPLQGELFMAAWSPDGKWLAAVEKGENGSTILMDAKTLTRQRNLGPSELDWSPDSQYLLGFKPCGLYSGTLEAIDVQSGERTIIESSECQVDRATTGWVSNDVYKE
jgi:WD40 repeat protein